MKRSAFALVVLLSASSAHAFLKVNLMGTVTAGRPLSVAVDDEGRIYIPQENGTVLVRSAQGEPVTKLGVGPDGKPFLDSPRGICISGQEVYVADEELDRIEIFSKNGARVGSIGKEGSKPKELEDPMGVAVFGGVIYVADKGNGRVQILGPNGVFMDAFPRPGSGVESVQPVALAVNAKGELFVLDKNAHRIVVFDQDGALIRSLTFTGETACFALDGDGIYIADAAGCKVTKYDFSGKEIFSFGSKGKDNAQFIAISGLAVDNAGRVYVSDIGKGTVSIFMPEEGRMPRVPSPTYPNTVKWRSIIKGVEAGKIIPGKDGKTYGCNRKEGAVYMIRDGVLEREIRIPKCKPSSLAQDQEGGLWVLDGGNDRVLLINEDGQILRQFGSGGSKEGYLDNPTDMAITRKGIILIVDKDNNRVQAFSADGLFLQAIGKDLENPVALTLDSQDTLYVVNGDDGTIHVFNLDGTRRGKFGGAPWLEEPVAVSATNSEIFVLDREAGRVKVFDKNGAFLRGFGAEGAAEGDLNRPTSMFIRDATELVVSDAGNKRLESFQLIFTPKAPTKFRAAAGMRSVKLSWARNAEEFVEEYRLYRNQPGGFKDLGTVRGLAYEDMDLEPDRAYEYAIGAVARGGNQSSLSETAAATPTKFIPVPPTGLAAKTEEWSLELAWNANPEPFVTGYSVYRQIDGIFQKVANSEGTTFREDSLDQETAYCYAVAAVSSDGVESEKALIKASTKAATKPPVEVEVVKMSNIFSNSYKIYETNGIGVLRVTNNTRETIARLRLSFTIQNFMDFPSEVGLENIPPGKSEEIPIKAVFNNNILQLTEDTPVQTEIRATYFRNQKPMAFAKSHTINVYDKHKLMWDTRERFAAFITPKDSSVLEFVRSVVTQYPEADNPLILAGVIFNALGVAGVSYVADPSNPYQVTSGKTDFVDYIQYPRETLKRNSGDCDDLVGLYSSALEGLGIRTMVLDIPGHMLMMFSSDIQDTAGVELMDGMFVSREGMLWVPVEVTSVGTPFLKAWEEGSRTYHKWENKNLGLMDIRSAWEAFKPATLPQSSQEPRVISRAQIDTRFPSEVNTLRKICVKYQGAKYVETLKNNPEDFHSLNNLAILYARAGEVDESIRLFRSAIEIAPEDAAIWNNLGNAFHLAECYDLAQVAYETSAKIDPNDPLVLVNLSRTCIKAGRKGKAADVFNQAVRLDPSVKREYRSMAIELSGAY